MNAAPMNTTWPWVKPVHKMAADTSTESPLERDAVKLPGSPLNEVTVTPVFQDLAGTPNSYASGTYSFWTVVGAGVDPVAVI